MNNINTDQQRTWSCRGTGVWAGILLLIIGLIIGVFGSKHYWQKSAIVAENNRAPQPATTSIAAQATAAIAPSQQISDMQKQVDQVFKQSAPQFASSADVNTIQRQISDMQKQIDQVFQQSFPQSVPVADVNAAEGKPGYSLSMDVRDLKNKYQVCAFLPDTKPSDVKVNLNGDELKVDMNKQITEKPTAKNGETAMTEWGNYEEVVRLAGPLKDSQMTVQRLPHELVISVPKA